MQDKIVLELKDTVNNNNLEELKDFIISVKNIGLRVAIDNVGIHYHKMDYLILLDIDYINIDKGLLNSKDNESASDILDLIIAFSKHGVNNKKKLIALKVETEEELELAKNKDFDYYQGWFLKDQQIVF